MAEGAGIHPEHPTYTLRLQYRCRRRYHSVESQDKLFSARRGQFILSNAATWSIFSAVFLLIKPRRAVFSSIRRQRRTWTCLGYDESVQETSRRKKYGYEDFMERHLWNKCSTERHSNPAGLICKTIEHVIRNLRNNGQGVRSHCTQAERPPISIVRRRSRTKEKCWQQSRARKQMAVRDRYKAKQGTVDLENKLEQCSITKWLSAKHDTELRKYEFVRLWAFFACGFMFTTVKHWKLKMHNSVGFPSQGREKGIPRPLS